MSSEASAGGEDRARELTSLLDLRMCGDTEAIAAVTEAVSNTLSHLDVPEEKRLEIALAVQEALANAVVHGCKNDSSKEVRCRLERDSDGRILITVTDPGHGFHPEGLSNPMDPANLYAGHGR